MDEVDVGAAVGECRKFATFRQRDRRQPGEVGVPVHCASIDKERPKQTSRKLRDVLPIL
jgi:hypothetical protein